MTHLLALSVPAVRTSVRKTLLLQAKMRPGVAVLIDVGDARATALQRSSGHAPLVELTGDKVAANPRDWTNPIIPKGAERTHGQRPTGSRQR